MKDLKYYQELDYSIIIEPTYCEGKKWYTAYCHELGKFSCYGQGKTRISALSSFYKEKNDFIELLFESGKEIPEPKNYEPIEKSIPASLQFPEFELVRIISGACLKHHDSGEGSFNKEARVILMELENKGYKVVKG